MWLGTIVTVFQGHFQFPQSCLMLILFEGFDEGEDKLGPQRIVVNMLFCPVEPQLLEKE